MDASRSIKDTKTCHSCCKGSHRTFLDFVVGDFILNTCPMDGFSYMVFYNVRKNAKYTMLVNGIAPLLYYH